MEAGVQPQGKVIPRAEWRRFVRDFGAAHRGWLVSVAGGEDDGSAAAGQGDLLVAVVPAAAGAALQQHAHADRVAAVLGAAEEAAQRGAECHYWT